MEGSNEQDTESSMYSRERAEDRIKKEAEAKEEKAKEKPGIKDAIKEEAKKAREPIAKKIYDLYDKQYKKLLIISFLILAFSISFIAYEYATTGDFMERGVSLKGGLTLTIPTTEPIDANALQSELSSKFPEGDFDIRILASSGRQAAVSISASDVTEAPLVQALEERFGKFKEGDYAVEVTGGSLGESFFKETFKAIILAFLLMGVVVFLYFSESTLSKVIVSALSFTVALIVFFSKSPALNIIALLLSLILIWLYYKFSIPSLAVMLAAASSMVTTLAVIDLLGVKLSTGGIAGFLMLIGYSVDTDILLSTRILKIKSGTVLDKTIGAMKTGLTMTFAAMGAVLSAYLITEATMLKQIMLILFIGLFFDIIYTWIQNAGILRWHLEKAK